MKWSLPIIEHVRINGNVWMWHVINTKLNTYLWDKLVINDILYLEKPKKIKYICWNKIYIFGKEFPITILLSRHIS